MAHGTSDPLHGDIGRLLASDPGQSGSLRGFDPDFRDIVDYIVRITHRIWEEHDPGLIDRYYHPEVVIHTADGSRRGRAAVTAGSLATMAAFPDLRLYTDEVIWSGDPEEGFHTSHRIVWLGHHTGSGSYGPPSGRRVLRRGIAHCLVRDNRIVEEWICRDELALLQQLALDPLERARSAAPAEPPAPATTHEIEAQLEALDGAEGDTDPEGFVHHTLHLLFNRRLLGRARERFAESFSAHLPPGRIVHGFGAYRAQLLALLSALPDLALTIDHQCHLGDENSARVATRWRLHGSHQGPGFLGEPTGRRVTLLGISHHLLADGRIVREDSCYDLFALLKQLHGPLPEGPQSAQL